MEKRLKCQGDICCREIARSFAGHGDRYRVVSPAVGLGDVAMKGRLELLELRAGLWLHSTDAVAAEGLVTELRREPGMSAMVFLEGEVDVSLGGQDYAISTRRMGGPVAFVLSCAEPDWFIRRIARGTLVRKVGITFPPDWVQALPEADAAMVRRLARTHGGSALWRPSRVLVDLSRQLLAPPDCLPYLADMVRESRALDLVAHLLEELGLQELGRHPDGDEGRGITAREASRIRIVCDVLEERLDVQSDETLSLDTIARDAGMSVSTMQRLFRTVHGVPVIEYVRQRRLDRARLMLERDGISVTEASFQAGYSSPANFSTAFKRAFGVSPSRVRRG